jgi:UDP-N-acetylmuramoyl-L-alanyl-D-glutamate--2,6-diaminopimelate ligase
LGDYNKYNIGAAELVAKMLDVRSEIIVKTVKEFRGVLGRREEVNEGQDFKVIVDFAHTPNALEQVLDQLRKELPDKSKLIAVFGCTGGRDKSKRPMMGEIAARLADTVIITSDDTRNESQDEIAKQIIAGITPSNLPPNLGGRNKEGSIWVENDRKKAIEKAINMAHKGDIILLAGKGHEKTILLGKTEYPWSDKEVAKEIISGLKL